MNETMKATMRDGEYRTLFIRESGMDKEGQRLEDQVKLLRLRNLEEFDNFSNSKYHPTVEEISKIAKRHAAAEWDLAQQAVSFKVGYSLQPRATLERMENMNQQV